jgi:hypothetical protein
MTNLATAARSLGGNALKCIMTACAVILGVNHSRANLASGKGRQRQGPTPRRRA